MGWLAPLLAFTLVSMDAKRRLCSLAKRANGEVLVPRVESAGDLAGRRSTALAGSGRETSCCWRPEELAAGSDKGFASVPPKHDHGLATSLAGSQKSVNGLCVMERPRARSTTNHQEPGRLLRPGGLQRAAGRRDDGDFRRTFGVVDE